MFGSQPLSTRPSPANYGFGSSTRNHRNRLYIGEMYAKTSNISCTPGPCYETQGSMASQADSGKLSTPQWQFGTSQRFASPRSTLSGTPAPGTYESASSFQRQSLSQRTSFPRFGFGTVDRDMAAKVFISPSHASSSFGRSSPGPAAPYMRETGLAGYKFGFGTEERFGRTARQLHDAAESPGPGSYEDKGVLGQQSSSKLDTVASFGFGSSTREHVARVFCNDMMARASGRSGMGNFTPGPPAYNIPNGIGIQPTSRGRSAPSWGFGKDRRYKDNTYETISPGPGAYAT